MKTMRLSAFAAATAALIGVSGAASAAEYANVVSATPVTGTVSVPVQSCVDVERVVQPQPSGAGALIGAIAGGVLGNQFGHGFGRAAATGLGVVAGSSIGNQVEANNNPAVAVAGRDCRTVSQVQRRVIGYDVVYDYNGQRYTHPHRRRSGPAPGHRRAPASGLRRCATAGVRQRARVCRGAAAGLLFRTGSRLLPARRTYYGAPAYYGPAIGIGVGVGYGYGWHHGYRRW